VLANTITPVLRASVEYRKSRSRASGHKGIIFDNISKVAVLASLLGSMIVGIRRVVQTWHLERRNDADQRAERIHENRKAHPSIRKRFAKTSPMSGATKTL
jgi:hypothetical protein